MKLEMSNRDPIPNTCKEIAESATMMIINNQGRQIKFQEKQINNLKKQIKILEKSNDFYAYVACPLPKQLNDNEQVEDTFDMDGYYERGGKRAREVKQQLKQPREGSEK